MSIHVKTSKDRAGINDKIHYMPCRIVYDGDANITDHFKNFVEKDEKSEVLNTSFRGHVLKGKMLKLPPGYYGSVIHETTKPGAEDADRNAYVTHTFKSLTLWEWDDPPSKGDVFLRALDWIDVADALHSPIED